MRPIRHFLLLILVFHSFPLRSFANQIPSGGEPSIPPGTLGISLAVGGSADPLDIGPYGQMIVVLAGSPVGYQDVQNPFDNVYPKFYGPVHVTFNNEVADVAIGQLGLDERGETVIKNKMVEFGVLVNGSISRDFPTEPNVSGGFTGTATSAALLGNTTLADLPPPVADLFAHPERIHVKADVEGGSNNWLYEFIIVDPPGPTPVPEPSTLAVFLAGAGAFHIVRRRARHGTRRSATASARPR